MFAHIFCSVSSIDRTLSGFSTPGQREPGSYGNEGVFCNPQSSSINRSSTSDYLVSYQGYSLEVGFYPSAAIQPTGLNMYIIKQKYIT